MLASEMTPGTVYSHSVLGLVTPVLWTALRLEVILRDLLDGTESNARSGLVLVLCLSKSRSETCGSAVLLSADDEVHKAFGIY